MLEFVPFNSAEVIGLRVSGKLGKDDIQRVIDVSEMKLSAMGQGARLRVYVEVESFGGLSFEALLEDLKFGLAHLGDIDRKAVVSDIVYVPLKTPLLAAAEARGLATSNGLDMLLHQAVRGFELWFGVRPEVTRELYDLLAADIESAA